MTSEVAATIAAVTVLGDFETELKSAGRQGSGVFHHQQIHFSHGICLQIRECRDSRLDNDLPRPRHRRYGPAWPFLPLGCRDVASADRYPGAALLGGRAQ